MKTRIFGALMFLVLTVPAQAAYISGVVLFNSKLAPDTGSLDQAITFVEMRTGFGKGFFNGFPVTPWEPFALPAGPAIGQPVSLVTADFGAFSGTVIDDQGEYAVPTGFFRNVVIRGAWAPGNASVFSGYTDPVQADFIVTLNRDAAVGEAIIPSVVFYAKGVPVPEPAIGFGVPLALTAAGFVYRRRRQLRATSC